MSVEESALYFHIVFVEEPITAAEYKILYDRTRLTLQVELVHAQPPGSIPPPPRPRQEVHDGRVAGSKTRCWLYGRHSQDMARLGGRQGDRILLLAPKVSSVVRYVVQGQKHFSTIKGMVQVLVFKAKPLEVSPPDFSPWILHCGDQFEPRATVKLLRLEGSEEQGGLLVEEAAVDAPVQEELEGGEAAVVVMARREGPSPVKKREGPSQVARTEGPSQVARREGSSPVKRGRLAVARQAQAPRWDN